MIDRDEERTRGACGISTPRAAHPVAEVRYRHPDADDRVFRATPACRRGDGGAHRAGGLSVQRPAVLCRMRGRAVAHRGARPCSAPTSAATRSPESRPRSMCARRRGRRAGRSASGPTPTIQELARGRLPAEHPEGTKRGAHARNNVSIGLMFADLVISSMMRLRNDAARSWPALSATFVSGPCDRGQRRASAHPHGRRARRCRDRREASARGRKGASPRPAEERPLEQPASVYLGRRASGGTA